MSLLILYSYTFETFFLPLNEIEEKKLGKKAEALRPEQILRAFPNDTILPEDKAVLYLQKETSLDEGTILHSIHHLIKDKKLITAYDTKNRLHIRKMKL
jgi:hypothetical protein